MTASGMKVVCVCPWLIPFADLAYDLALVEAGELLERGIIHAVPEERCSWASTTRYVQTPVLVVGKWAQRGGDVVAVRRCLLVAETHSGIESCGASGHGGRRLVLVQGETAIASGNVFPTKRRVSSSDYPTPKTTQSGVNQ